MDIYSSIANNTYVTGITKVFLMPTKSGGIPAVAVTRNTADYITSAYTIMMILMFMIGWNLILLSITAFWRTNDDKETQTALDVLRTSSDSIRASLLIIEYSCVIFPRRAMKTVGCWLRSLLAIFIALFIALAFTVTNIIMGILVPGQLLMGNVAPPAKNAIFYPDIARYARYDDNSARIAKISLFQAPSALRALGAIELSEVTARERVHIDSGIAGGSARLSYDYNVTGVDMGLQSDHKLRLRIKGSCHTDDTWLLNSTDQGDTYRLFGGNDTLEVKYQPDVDLPPMVDFWVDTNTDRGSNFSYAMIVNTGGRYSYTSSEDPWYATDKAGDNELVPYRVRRKRPVLSCWEAKTWHLNGKDVEGSKLDTLPGLKLDKLWVNKVFPLEFTAPRVVRVGRAAGPSALKSAFYAQAPVYILDAGASNIVKDLERLVFASWVSSGNVLRDTTTYDTEGMENLAAGPGGSVEAASAKFVLQSIDVVTLSVRILISIPTILFFLFVAATALSSVYRHSAWGKERGG